MSTAGLLQGLPDGELCRLGMQRLPDGEPCRSGHPYRGVCNNYKVNPRTQFFHATGCNKPANGTCPSCVQVVGSSRQEIHCLPPRERAYIIFVCVCGCMDTPGRVEQRRRALKPPLAASAIVVPQHAGRNLWGTERRASKGSEERKESHGSQTVQAHQPGSALPDGF